MTAGQRFVRLVTDVVVRVPFAWRLFRGTLTRSFDKLAPTWEGRISDERLAPMRVALGALAAAARDACSTSARAPVASRASSRSAGREAKVVGADLSPGMIDEARRLGGDVHYDVADATALPYDDGAFELVTLSNMIPFFDELARVTAPGGSVIVAFTMGDRTPIYVPVRAGAQRARAARVFARCGLRRGHRHSAPCQEGRPVVTSRARRRSRRGSTGPDVSFLVGIARVATIAFFPEGAYGPTNNCVGIGDVLRRRGHRVVFIVEESFAGTLEAQGFEERLMRLTPPPLEEEVPGQFWKDFIRDTAPVFRLPTIEQLAGFIAPTFQALVDGAKYVDDRLHEIIDELEPA